MLNKAWIIPSLFYSTHFVAYFLKIDTMNVKAVMSLDVTGIFKNCEYWAVQKAQPSAVITARVATTSKVVGHGLPDRPSRLLFLQRVYAVRMKPV